MADKKTARVAGVFMTPEQAMKHAPLYKPPSGHDKHLGDADRAHSGAPGAKVRHGADATGKAPKRLDSRGNDMDDPAWKYSYLGTMGGADRKK